MWDKVNLHWCIVNSLEFHVQPHLTFNICYTKLDLTLLFYQTKISTISFCRWRQWDPRADMAAAIRHAPCGTKLGHLQSWVWELLSLSQGQPTLPQARSYISIPNLKPTINSTFVQLVISHLPKCQPHPLPAHSPSSSPTNKTPMPTPLSATFRTTIRTQALSKKPTTSADNKSKTSFLPRPNITLSSDSSLSISLVYLQISL